MLTSQVHHHFGEGEVDPETTDEAGAASTGPSGPGAGHLGVESESVKQGDTWRFPIYGDTPQSSQF